MRESETWCNSNSVIINVLNNCNNSDIVVARMCFVFQERVLEIEYIERHPAPEPEDSLTHDDWVSSVVAAAD